MLSLFANSALMRRFLSYMGLVPLILKFVDMAERTTGLSGAGKRAMVLEAINVTIFELGRRGYIPPELNENLERTAVDLIDVVVGIYNHVGFFTHETPPAPAVVVAVVAPEDSQPGT